MNILVRKLLSLALAAALLGGLSACVSPAATPDMVDYAYVPTHLPNIKGLEDFQ